MKGWKTILFNVITFALAGLQAIDLTDIIPQNILALIIAFGNMVLRLFTSTPVGKSS